MKAIGYTLQLVPGLQGALSQKGTKLARSRRSSKPVGSAEISAHKPAKAHHSIKSLRKQQ